MASSRIREVVYLAVAAIVVATVLTVAARVAVGPMEPTVHRAGVK